MDRSSVVGLAILAIVVGASLSIVPHILSRTYLQSVKQGVSVRFPEGYVEARLGGLRTFGSYSELLEYLNNLVKLKQVVSEATGGYYLLSAQPGVRGLPGSETAVSKATPQTALATADSRVHKTNVQVESVDEPDIAKTDGEIVVVAVGNTAFIVDAAEKKVLGRFEVDSVIVGMFLVDKKLVVVSSGTVPYAYTPLFTRAELLPFSIPAGAPNTTVYLVDVRNAANPVTKLKVSVTGHFLSARLANNSIYVLTTLPLGTSTVPTVNGIPVAPGSIGVVDEEPDAYTTIVVVDTAGLSYTAYSFLTGSGSWVYMSPTRLYVGASRYLTTTTIYKAFLEVLVRHLPREVADEVRGLLSAGAIAKALEVAQKYLSSASDEEFKELITLVNEDLGAKSFSEETVFHVFGLSGLSVRYSGSFSVNGLVLDQFSMEEMGDHFVVATTESYVSLKVYTYRVFQEPTGRPITIVEYEGTKAVNTKTYTPASRPAKTSSRLYSITPVSVGESENGVFVIDLRSFSTVGSLRGLAKGERIYSARLVKNVLFLVTFRQVDPLFAIDLSDPRDPRVLGYLKIPGFSEYLHPVSEDRLLGVGLEDGNLKLSLFDVSKPTGMVEVSKILIECSWSPALSDHRAVTVDRDFALVYLPLWSYCYSPPAGGVSVIRYGGASLSYVTLLEVDGALRALYIGKELYVVSSDRLVVYTIPELEYVAEVLLR